MSGSHSWDQSLREFGRARGLIVTVGPVDSGKTTWVASCARQAADHSVAVVSADLGQVTFGVPGLLSAARCPAAIDRLTDLPPERMYFVGQSQPGGRFLQTIHGILRLAAWARERAGTVLIDTDGFIAGPAGREYKRILLSSLGPCTALFFGCHPDLNPLHSWCKSMADIAVYDIDPPDHIRPKSDELRQQYRLARYRDWFREALSHSLSLKTNRLLSSLTAIGEPLGEEELARIRILLGTNPLWAEKSATHLNVLTPAPVPSENLRRLREAYGEYQVSVPPGSQWEGRLIGDFGASGFSSGMGYITGWRGDPPRLLLRGRFGDSPGETWLVGEESYPGTAGQ